MQLLIDDVRTMPVDKIVRTYDEGIQALQENKWDIVWLDHDLGCFKDGKEYTGYTILCWLEENPRFLPRSIRLITSNPVGRARMQMVIDKLYGT